MEFDFSKLSGKIVEKYKSQSIFAAIMGMSERTLSLKLNNKVSWRNTETHKCAQLLGIEQFEISEYFFKEKVQNFKQKEAEDGN